MARDGLLETVRRLLALADVRIGGDRSWDIQVHNDTFYERILTGGSLGLGEAYVDGWWDCDCLDAFSCRVLRAELDCHVTSWRNFLAVVMAKLSHPQKLSRAFEIGKHHYDIGNDLYGRMLGERLIYSCGYWKDATTLDEAQEAKLDLVCRKLGLEPGMRVLDIGCGWGGLAQFAVEQYRVEVVGITVSEKQVKFARQLCQGLPVEIRLQDYRSLEGMFDRIVSLGMFEHVGWKNYGTFMRVVRRCLKADGLFLLHTIGGNRSTVRTDPWIDRYIFPNSVLPSVKQISGAIEGLFVLEDWHSFGVDYDKTLMSWFQNFQAHWGDLQERYDERFYRMWTYYLLCCAGAFRARRNQLWQIVLSPRGVEGGYPAPR